MCVLCSSVSPWRIGDAFDVFQSPCSIVSLVVIFVVVVVGFFQREFFYSFIKAFTCSYTRIQNCMCAYSPSHLD